MTDITIREIAAYGPELEETIPAKEPPLFRVTVEVELRAPSHTAAVDLVEALIRDGQERRVS